MITFLLILGLNSREMPGRLPDFQKRRIEMDCLNQNGSKLLHQNNFPSKCQIKNKLILLSLEKGKADRLMVLNPYYL